MSTTSSDVTRQRIWIAIALCVLAVYAVLSISDAWSASARLEEARAELSEIETKISTIQRTKQTPRVAALNLEAPDDIVKRISAAMKVAGLPQSAFKNQSSGTPKRIQKSDFTLRSITINLQASTLLQIVKFCDALRDEKTGSIVRDIVLTIPRTGAGSANQERWDAQLILTQMIFSPTSE